jgi:hypothetical protein
MRKTLSRFSLLTLAFGLLVGPAFDADAKKGKRFGIEGEIMDYDEQNKTITVKILSTKVSGRSFSGNTVGGKAPGDIKRLKQYKFAIEPEGSVLRRTVIKGTSGGGLDPSGTSEGFKQAYSMIPKARGVAMSLQDNDPAAVKNGAPKYKIMMIQIQLTMEELERRFNEISVEE